ncbi:flagellar hook assembly protein FlgD [Kineosporia babensis]|uniref:Flagellar basal-body rod modification protein FlgD n=1 Tax=Kineosporia babensis TaxID=499548 RepID=A0A9X1SRP0_9ACTN|nr:flagellar hook capping FlgD N-terminal domain-containing protein [Kineosporia babensis]MCD5309837.1 hypothetical protein [Kineosporia babensis]
MPTAGPVGNIADTVKAGQEINVKDVSRATNSTTSDKDMFLKLLLAQMKYQDPLNPTDSAQYLSQMAQFTTVEKLETLADNTASLLTASQMQSSLNMVGATVEYGVGDKKGSGTVTGLTMVDGVPQLLVTDAKGTKKVALIDITSVKAAGTASAPEEEEDEKSPAASGSSDPGKTDDTGTI